MNWKQIFRAVVCLLVVCCLVVNAAAPQAHATGVELIVGTAVSVAAVHAVGSILVGLGVSPGSNQTVFDDLVNGAVDMLTEAGKVVGGMLSVWSLANSSVKYAIEPEIIETLRDWLVTEAIVSQVELVGSAYYGESLLPALPDSFLSDSYPFRYVFLNTSSNVYSFYSYSLLPASFVINSSGLLVFRFSETPVNVQFSTLSQGSWGRLSENTVYTPSLNPEKQKLIWSSHDIISEDGVVFCVGSEPIGYKYLASDEYASGYIAPSADSLADGYADWAANSITLPGSEADDEDRVLWPMGLGPDYLGTISKPQTDVWIGASEYTVPDVIPDVTTPAVSLDGVLADTNAGTFVDALADVISAPFKWLADTLLEGIKSIFVPSADFLSAKVDSLRAEYAFADSIVSAGEFVGSTLQSLETEPPVIYIDFSTARGSFAPGGKYPLGGKEVFIDMSWYAEYKPIGDALLSALLWIAFIWRMFIKLPGIISGMPGDFVMDGLHQIGLADRLPARNAAYEVQRISNRQSLRRGPGR